VEKGEGEVNKDAHNIRSRKPQWAKPFFCDICKKSHGDYVMRNLVDGFLLCDRQYFKYIEKKEKGEAKGRR